VLIKNILKKLIISPIIYILGIIIFKTEMIRTDLNSKYYETNF
jgi:hypothetical protein